MRKLLTILYVVLAIEVFVITSSAVIGQFSPHQKPMLGLQIDPTHPLGNGKGGLDGAWFFNENSGNKVQDLSGGNTGTLQADTHFVPGKFGSVLDFDGAGDYVDVTMTILIPYTIVIYLKNEAYTETYPMWLRSVSPSANTLQLGAYASGNMFYSLGSFFSANYVVLGAWQQFVYVFDGSTVALFVDGVFKEAPSFSSETVNSFTFSTPNDSIDGQIDHVLIYNRALNASEIAELYREPFGMFKKDDIALLATAAEPPLPPSGQVIMIQMSIIPLFLITALVFIRIKNGNKTI